VYSTKDDKEMREEVYEKMRERGQKYLEESALKKVLSFFFFFQGLLRRYTKNKYQLNAQLCSVDITHRNNKSHT
jgi:hypothetical protein